MSILSTSSAAWVIDVSRCLGLVDLEPCHLHEAPSPSPSPVRGPPGGGVLSPRPQSTRLYRKLSATTTNGNRYSSTPCLKKTKGLFCSVGSLVDAYPGVDRGLETSFRDNQGGDSVPNSPSLKLRRGQGHPWRPSLSASASRLDCSVHYSDGAASPPGEDSRGTASDHLFFSARSTLVHRVCGAPAGVTSLIAEHPFRSHRRPRRGSKWGFSMVPPTANPPRGKVPATPPMKRFVRSRSEGHITLDPTSEEGPEARGTSSVLSTYRSTSDSYLLLKETVESSARRGRRDSSPFLNLWIKWKFGNNLDRNEEQTNIFTADSAHNEIPKQKVLRRTRSDMSKSRSPQRHLLAGDAYHRQSLGRQYSSPQPMKVRPYHRLPNYSADPSQRNSGLKRSKGSTHLRRSVSQPLDLDKSFMAQISFLKMRVPDEPLVKKQCRRPSVGNLLSDDNTSEEEGGLSDNEDLRQEFKRCLEDEEDVIVFAEALWDHVSLDSDELVFKAGELITVLDSSDKDWWWGRTTRRSGWFPASFVRLLVNQEDHQQEEETGSIAEDANGSPRRLSLSSLSHDQVRANVINEILCTERDYVKHLKDVVEGYLRQVRKRPDMFSAETIATIFGNMEAVFDFHSQFLNELELCIDYDNPHRSCVGDCFIRNKSRFEIYSEYCNNHPSAVSELQELYQDQKYVHFFEACRLLQEMIDISLDGFLLTPVQKICKYPLQLQELLKYTKPNHPDYSTVRGATQAMKEVALLVNERRRRMECLEKIASWQKGVEGWEGADLLDDSSQLIHQGEVTKGVGGSWPKEMTLFLFDHQMIYCKRDLLKRNTFVYRGRINTDLCEVIDIPDDPVRSAAFQNAWKIHYLHKSKTYAFTCKTAEEKTKWLQAFKRERALVALDEASGFVASEKQKQVARMAARNQRSRPKKPRVKSRSRKQVMTYAQAQRLVNTKKAEENRSNSLPVRSQPPPSEVKKKGHWFSFGGNKKGRNSGRTQKISNTLHTS